MTELKLRRLYRGYVFTDFDGNEVGCKDSDQAIDEIKKLLEPDKKLEEQITEKPPIEKPVEEQITEKSPIEKPVEERPVAGKLDRKPRYNRVELQRKIFEAAKEQINLIGKVNAAQISRDLNISPSSVGNHLKVLENELNLLIKKWQDERDKKMVNAETRIDPSGDESSVS